MPYQVSYDYEDGSTHTVEVDEDTVGPDPRGYARITLGLNLLLDNPPKRATRVTVKSGDNHLATFAVGDFKKLTDPA